MGKNNPFKGLFQYTAADEKRFFGREREAVELVEMIKSSQLVTLYGESGTGKTSLIQAKLFPELQRQYYFPVYIRINYTNGVAPLLQLKQTVYTELQKWDDKIGDFGPDESLIAFAARTTIFNGLGKPIFFFDQFEELFTIGPRYWEEKELGRYVSELADLIEVRIPADLRENVLNYTVVLSLRQDFVANLDDLRSNIPSIGNNRYGIKRFSGEQVRFALSQSILKYNEDGFVPKCIMEVGVTELIISDVIQLEQGGLDGNATSPALIGVDPTMLSLYGYQLFEDALKTGENKTITRQQVAKLSAGQTIEAYYLNSLTTAKQRSAAEKYLITADGRRLLYPLADFVKNSGLTEKEITDLQAKTAIFRIYGAGDSRQIELAHDQIAKRALISKNKRAAGKIRRNVLIAAGVLILVVATIAITVLAWVREREKTTTYQYQAEKIRAQADSLRIAELRRSRLQDSLLYRENIFMLEMKKNNDLQLANRSRENMLTQALGGARDSLKTTISSLNKKVADYIALQQNYTNTFNELTQLKNQKKTDPKNNDPVKPATSLTVLYSSNAPCSPGNQLNFERDSLVLAVNTLFSDNTVAFSICEKRKVIDYKNPLTQGNMKLSSTIRFSYKNELFAVYYDVISRKVPHFVLLKYKLE